VSLSLRVLEEPFQQVDNHSALVWRDFQNDILYGRKPDFRFARVYYIHVIGRKGMDIGDDAEALAFVRPDFQAYNLVYIEGAFGEGHGLFEGNERIGAAKAFDGIPVIEPHEFDPSLIAANARPLDDNGPGRGAYPEFGLLAETFGEICQDSDAEFALDAAGGANAPDDQKARLSLLFFSG
jgi:hypothetical protein